ncbi:MAG: glycosyl hydrolase 53 family protein [Chthoniobacterales bacterium]
MSSVSTLKCNALCFLIALFAAIFAVAELRADEFMLGVDANYSLDMEKKGARWKWNGTERELFAGMHEQGVRWLRVRLWTGDESVNGKEYATRVVERATKAGLNPYLVIFLSEDWADLTKQPAPAIWKDLPLEQRAEAVRNYAREIVRHFRDHGLTSHLYEIGNEIDYGICGVFPGKHAKKDPLNLSRNIWPESAKLILACERGVKESDPEAKFLLHIAHWWDADFCIAFFQFMLDQQVQIDFAGLSYFPSSNIGNSLTLDQFRTTVDRVTSAIDRPIVIAETAYPSTADFQGQFANWRVEVPGYPLTPEGQEKWLGDFVAFCTHHPKIAGAFYWSPEWFGEGMWKAFALFDVNGNAQPAWQAFRAAH